MKFTLNPLYLRVQEAAEDTLAKSEALANEARSVKATCDAFVAACLNG